MIFFLPSILALLGGVRYSWNFDRDGFVGMLINAGDPGDDRTNYSILNVGIILIQEQIFTSSLEAFTIWFCAFCCIGFALICPILQQLAMMYVWTKPLTLRQLKIFYFVVEVASGWATMDVFVVSIIVSLLQVGMLSEFMIPPVCGFLEAFVPYDIIDQKDAVCFYVKAGLGTGAFNLFLAAISAAFSLQLFQGAALAAVEDRESRIKGIDVQGQLNLGMSSKWAYFQFKIFELLGMVDLVS